MDINFPDWMLDEMNARGWSQTELAYRAKISRTAISDILSKRRSAGPEICRSLARAFGYREETVFRVAGLLTSHSDLTRTEEIDMVDDLFLSLPEPDQREIIEFMILKKRLAENRRSNDKTVAENH